MKGGVGKSAITVFLADFLSSLHAMRVLVIDLDPQGSAAKALIPERQIDQGFQDGKSVTTLLRQVLNHGANRNDAEACLFRRSPKGKPRKGSNPLLELSVLATDRRDWRDLTEKITGLPSEIRSGHLDILKHAIEPLKDDFDVAVIDFPGSEIPFWTTMGLRATDRWLLPEIPDYFSIADIDSVVEQVHDAQVNSAHTIWPLGTHLNICPNRGSQTYRKARAALHALEQHQAIPRLFSKDAEVLHRPEAQSATDMNSEALQTLVKRYGPSTSPFHVGLRKLANEVLERIGRTTGNDRISVLGSLRRILADYWR